MTTVKAPTQITQRDGPDPQPGHYYVSAIQGGRAALALGPFATHADALVRVDEARRFAERHTREGRFGGLAWGTARLDDSIADPPEGRLNAAVGATQEAA